MSIVGLPSKEYILKDLIKNEFNLKIFQAKNSIIFHARLIGDLSETLYTEETDFEEFPNLNRFFKQVIMALCKLSPESSADKILFDLRLVPL